MELLGHYFRLWHAYARQEMKIYVIIITTREKKREINGGNVSTMQQEGSFYHHSRCTFELSNMIKEVVCLAVQIIFYNFLNKNNYIFLDCFDVLILKIIF